MPPAGRRAHAPALAKLSPPRHGRAFKRERLFAELERAADRPATWIFGPPGFGKTTLVATWLGGAASVDRLAAALWPDAEGDLARNSFDNALHRLRKLLGGDQHLMLRAGTLGINPGSCWTDLAALDALFVRAAAVADEPATLVAIAQQVLALYAGPLLPGDDGLQDVVAARGQLQARFVRELSAIGARLEALGQLEAALDVYRRAIEQDPLAEVLYRRLMSGLAALGRRAEAYEAYRRCRSQLSILLGVSPAPATEALAATLRDA